LTGYFTGSATFRSAAPSTVTQPVTGSGAKNIFLAKYDAAGVLQWVTKAGSQFAVDAEGTSIALDQAGGVYIAGYFSGGEANFYHQPGTAFAYNLWLGSNYLNPTLFVAKYTNAGTFSWARAAKGSGYARADGVAVNPAGTKVVVAGRFGGLLNFGNSVVLSNGTTAFSAAFVASYDGLGAIQWAQMAGGISSTAESAAVALDSADSVYATGDFRAATPFSVNPATPSGGVSATQTLTSLQSSGGSNTFDVFLAKYAASGPLQWLRSAGGHGNDFGYGITFQGHPLVTGYFELTADFGTKQVTSQGNFDVFVARANSSTGLFDWAVRAGGTGNDGGRALAAVSPTTVYVAGAIQSNPASFGSNTISSVAGSEDVFVAKLDYVSTPDLYIQDAANDIGDEPDVQAGTVLWASPDIWVRNAKATQTAAFPPRYTDEHNHQNPEYAAIAANTPWIYVKTRNRGSSAVSGTLEVYWANASLGLDWNSDWTQIPSATTAITNLAPGDEWVVELQWTTIPLPSLSVGGHFCLLARFVADGSTPDPIVGEVTNNGIWGNVYNSNHIAWKNVTVEDNVLNKEAGGMVYVHNIRRRSSVTKLVFDAPKPKAAKMFFGNGQIEIDLGRELFRKWVRGGRAGEGISAGHGTVIRLSGPGAWIGNLLLDPGEQHAVHVRFRLQPQARRLARKTFDFDLSQYETVRGRTIVIGGERFIVRTGEPRYRDKPAAADPAR